MDNGRRKAKKRYLEELALCGGMHNPYLADSTAAESFVDWQTWPNVELDSGTQPLVFFIYFISRV